MSITTYTTKSGTVRHRVEVEVGRRLDGSPDRRTRVCDTMREAKRTEREFEAQKTSNGGRSDRITFGEFTEHYYLPTKRGALRKTTMRGYESVITNHLMPELATIALCDINRLQIQTLLSSKATYKVAKNTRDMLRQILGEALQMEVINTNPAAGRFRLPDKKDTDHDNAGEWVSSLAEQHRIIALADDVLRPVLVLGFCFGLRKGEILGLDWADIDFAARTLSVRKNYIYTKGEPELTAPKTEKSARKIPITNYAAAELLAIRGKHPRVGPVCVSEGKRMTPYAAQKLMRRFVLSHEVPRVTCHSLRHSFATASLRSGAAVEQVSKWMGHTNITTTYNRYVKPLQDDLWDVADVLDKAHEAVV